MASVPSSSPSHFRGGGAAAQLSSRGKLFQAPCSQAALGRRGRRRPERVPSCRQRARTLLLAGQEPGAARSHQEAILARQRPLGGAGGWLCTLDLDVDLGLVRFAV